MDSILVSLWSARNSMPDIINQLERPTQKARAKKILDMVNYTWQTAWYFCNDHIDGNRPYAAFQTTAKTVKAFAAKNKCSLEDAWTQLDPLPN